MPCLRINVLKFNIQSIVQNKMSMLFFSIFTSCMFRLMWGQGKPSQHDASRDYPPVLSLKYRQPLRSF